MKRYALLWGVLLLLFLTSCAQTSLNEEKPTASVTPKVENSSTITPPAASPPSQSHAEAAPALNAAEPEESYNNIQSSESRPDYTRTEGAMGTVFYVPAGFDKLDERANIGYQYAYYQSDLDMRIEVHEIAPAYIPYAAIDTTYDSLAKSPDVTYLTRGSDWFVASGYLKDGAQIFYYKYASENKSDLKYFEITYPTASRDTCDAIVEQFEKTCSFYGETGEPSNEQVKPTNDRISVTSADRVTELLLYAGSNGDSVWHFVEPIPDDPKYNFVGTFTFYESEVQFSAGYQESEILFYSTGSWKVNTDGKIELNLPDEGANIIVEYILEDNGDRTLTLTQVSDGHLFYYHETGHEILLEKGRW